MPGPNGSVVADEPTAVGFDFGVGRGDFVWNIASVADEIPAWGTLRSLRDIRLREFMTTEPVFMSALGSMIAKYGAFGYRLIGPQRTAKAVQARLNDCEHGLGFDVWRQLTLLDMFTQDNGAFYEILREEDSPTSPWIQLNHLDSARCVRTGNRERPVIYYDIRGRGHELKWYQVGDLTEMPSAAEAARGMQYCALTRMLRAAQILRDIATYKYEKIGGRQTRAIHIVSGVTRLAIEDAITNQRTQQLEAGFVRYIQPIILATVDPTAKVDKVTLELASLPDGWDEEVVMKWYINQLALAFMADYQDFAPLPGGNLGTAQQSNVLHLKSRGKGAALFMRAVEQKFNFHGIMPRSVSFKFGEQDVAEDMELAKLRLLRAQTRAVQLKSGEITPEIARQMAQDDGDLEEEYLAMLGEENERPDIILDSGEKGAALPTPSEAVSLVERLLRLVRGGQ